MLRADCLRMYVPGGLAALVRMVKALMLEWGMKTGLSKTMGAPLLQRGDEGNID